MVASSKVADDSVAVVSITGTSVTMICWATEETFTETGMVSTWPTVRFTFCWTMVVKPDLVMVSV